MLRELHLQVYNEISVVNKTHTTIQNAVAFQRGENSLTRLTYEEGMKYRSRGLFCQLVKNRQP